MASAFPAFTDDAPDSAPPPQPAAKPPTLGEIVGAHWTLGRQDQIGAANSAEADAYGPVRHALEAANPNDDRPMMQRAFLPRYAHLSDNASEAPSLDTDAIWRDVASQRQRDPTFLRDVPAKDAAGFSTWVHQQQAAKRARAQDVAGRQQGVLQGAVGLAADLGTGFTDPINLGLMAVTGGVGGAGRSLVQTMAREALVNGATELAELPSIAGNRASFGEQMSAGDMALDVATAAGTGALFPAAGVLGRKAGQMVGETVAKGVDRAAPGWRAARALDREKLAGASDADILATYEGRAAPDARPPDETAAVHVVQRRVETDAARPFVRTTSGMAAHADALDEAIAAVESQLGLEPSAPAPPKAAPAATGAPLDRDRTIRFVLNDLEGGAAIARFSDADGGTTRYGIGSAFHKGVDIEHLTEDQAAAIAREKYWFPELDRADPKLAAVAFDAGWAMGPKAGKRLLAEAGGDADRALTLYRAELNRIADTVPGKAKFRRGWNNRVDKLARRLDGVEDSLPTLDPEKFETADAWRSAQDALDSERLAGEGRAASNPDVAEYVDRYIAGEGRGDTPADLELQQFAAINPPAIETEFRRRGTQPPASDPAPAPADDGRASAEEQDGSPAPEAPAPVEDRSATRQRASAMAISRRSTSQGRPDDLVRFLARRGGLRDDEGHDLRAGRGMQKFVPGIGMLVRERGMSLDRAREVAAEAGYFGGDPQADISNTTVADFLELLEKSRTGKRVVASEDLGRDAAWEEGKANGAQRDEQDHRTEEAIARFDEELAKIDAPAIDISDNEKLHVMALADHLYETGQGDIEDAIFEMLRQRQADPLEVAQGFTSDRGYAIPEYDADGLPIRDARDVGDESGGGEGGDGRSAAAGAEGGDRAASGEPGRARDVGPQPEDGAALDDAQAAGDTGPLPDDPQAIAMAAAAFDDPASPAATAQADSIEHDLRMGLEATVPQSAAGDDGLGPSSVLAFAPTNGSPGISVVEDGGDLVTAYWRDADGRARGAVQLAVSQAARDIYEHVSGFVDPSFRRQGIATKLYAALRDAGHPIDAASGRGDLTPDGAAFVNARARGGRLDPGARVDPAIADRQRQQAELGAKSPMRGNAEQDGTMGLGLFDATDQPGFRLEADGPELGFDEAMKAAELDLDAIEKARACMMPPKGEGE